MKQILSSILILSCFFGEAQEAKDLFKASDVPICWLGVDFSHVKLIGDFTEFSSAGEKNVVEIRDKYFPKWNQLILAEPDKYDVKGMLRKGDIIYEIDMIMKINAECATEDMEAYSNPNYSREDISKWVLEYPGNSVSDDLQNAIGVVLIAESLNKYTTEAYFHFVAINLKTKEVLVHSRLRGEPMGFGLRNYWAGAMYKVMKSIEKTHYKSWKNKYN